MGHYHSARTHIQRKADAAGLHLNNLNKIKISNQQLIMGARCRHWPHHIWVEVEEISSYYYYEIGEDCDIEQIDPKRTDPEYFVYECLNVEEVEKLLNESVEKLSTQLQITPSLAKVLLHETRWNTAEVIERYRNNASNLLVSARIKAAAPSVPPSPPAPLPPVPSTSSHSFCRDCWAMHFEIQIGQGISTQIECMEQRCDVRVPEDLVLTLLNRPMLRDKYQQFTFADYVKSHPELRFCPGPNCQVSGTIAV
uniref:RBR-type E3 ubiquitin transferase n=1 Tax=Anopheles maculatus TaxID=74869 RepID=A0A182SGV5_9DIPT